MDALSAELEALKEDLRVKTYYYETRLDEYMEALNKKDNALMAMTKAHRTLTQFKEHNALFQIRNQVR